MLGCPSLQPTAVRLHCLSPRPMATRRLLCVPYAGGGRMAFRGWAQLLPPQVEPYVLQLPAREERMGQPALQSWSPMMAAVIRALAALPPAPTAIYGHSLGALIALDIARWMEADQPGRLQHLFVAARPWPGHPAAAADIADLPDLADDALLEAMDRRYGSLSTGMSHPEIRDVVMPTLRADLRLLADHRHHHGPGLRSPLTVLAGDRDPATPAESVTGWRNETRGRYSECVLEDAAHFFIDTHRTDVVGCILDRWGAASP